MVNERLELRTTKFPFIFWSFNKAYKCEINFDNKIYKNIELSTEYIFEPINKWQFLSLKYLPVLCIFSLTFNIYDFYITKIKILEFLLAFLFAFAINFLSDLIRKIAIVATFSIGVALSIWSDEYYLLAYSLKYFLLISVGILFYLDLQYEAYSIKKQDRTISNFLISRKK